MAIPVGLAQLTGKPVHICHVARADEMALVRRAKEWGAPISCEVAPHHLFLSQADADRLGAFGAMKPSLGNPADVAALWANLDVVDIIASDHAPHTKEEKMGTQPPPGVPGVETMLPLLLDAVHARRLSLERVVALLRDGPERIFGVCAPDAQVEVEIGSPWTVSGSALHSQCGWTPFEGARLHGHVTQVRLRGDVVYRDGVVLAQPGSGRVLARSARRA